MPTDSALADLAHTIQLAVAPVFLLTALGTILGVLSSRLGRIVDRVRVLVALKTVDEASEHERLNELRGLSLRRKLINVSISLATLAALLVCVLIALAFLGFMLNVNFSLMIAGLFIGAMTTFIGALLLFLREVVVAVSSTRIL